MRLAALLHRTVEALHETMSVEEWNKWLLFNELYDLPDAFHVVAQLGTVIVGILGGKGKPENFSPYYQDLVSRPAPSARRPATPGPPSPSRRPVKPSPAPAGNNDLKPFYGFLSAYAKERAASGRPLPRSTGRGKANQSPEVTTAGVSATPPSMPPADQA